MRIFKNRMSFSDMLNDIQLLDASYTEQRLLGDLLIFTIVDIDIILLLGIFISIGFPSYTGVIALLFLVLLYVSFSLMRDISKSIDDFKLWCSKRRLIKTLGIVALVILTIIRTII